MATSLKAMAADPEYEVKKTDLWRINPGLLVEEPGFNLRDYEHPDVVEHIKGFAASYKAGDYVPPLVVRTDAEGRILIVEGHCRRLGAMLAIQEGADLPFVDCVSFKGGDVERVAVMLRSAEGLKLQPLEIAIGYLRLTRMGHDNKAIAGRMRKTVSHVEQMMLLATANSDVHALVRQGKVSASTAIEAVRQHRDNAGEFLAGQLRSAEEKGKSSVTRSAVKAWTPPRKVVVTVIENVDQVVKRLGRETRRELAELENLPDSELKGRSVTVDAKTMLDLLQAHAAVVDARKAKAQAEKAAQARASQGELDVEN